MAATPLSPRLVTLSAGTFQASQQVPDRRRFLAIAPELADERPPPPVGFGWTAEWRQ